MTQRLILTIFTLFLCVVGAAAASDMVPGEWKYTMKTGVQGTPVSTPSVTTYICLSAADVPFAVVTSGAGSKGGCRYENLRTIDGKTHYDMVCKDNGVSSGQFEFKSTATTVSGRGLIDTGTSRITQEWQGKRLGDCRQ